MIAYVKNEKNKLEIDLYNTKIINMKKKKSVSISGWLFYSIAIFVFCIGFAGLFARQFNFDIPYLTDTLIPIFDKYKVSTPGFASPGHTTELVVGHHWVFLICLGLAIVIAIIGKSVSNFFLYLAVLEKKKKVAAKKNTETKITPKKDTKASVGSSGNYTKGSGAGAKASSTHKDNPKEQQKESLNSDKENKIADEQVKKEPEPKPEPKGHHKSLAELTRQVSDIID